MTECNREGNGNPFHYSCLKKSTGSQRAGHDSANLTTTVTKLNVRKLFYFYAVKLVSSIFKMVTKVLIVFNI